MSGIMPSTPTPKTALNRSFTLPSKIATSSSHGTNVEIGATEKIETLFVHPEGKIIKFTTSSSKPSTTGSTDRGGHPWTSSTEKTLASGSLELYRVPGSVNFLHSGLLLHAILPRSNCWCVDGVSKFAMRVLPDTYYRIELPNESPEDLEKVEEFKTVLKKVLFYERTPCPFERGFSVDLPEQPTVRQKRRKLHGPAKKWKLYKANSWRPEDGGEPPQAEIEDTSGGESDEDSIAHEDSAAEDGQPETLEKQRDTSKIILNRGISVRDRARGLNAASRSFTAPSHSIAHEVHPSKLRANIPLDGLTSTKYVATSADDPARRSIMQEFPTRMPPSPPDSSAGFEIPEAVRSIVGEGELEDSVIIHDLDKTHLDSEVEVSSRDTIAPAPHEVAAGSQTPKTPEPKILHHEQAVERITYGTTPHDCPVPESPSPADVQGVSEDAQSSEFHRTNPQDLIEEHSPINCDPFAQIQARIQARRSIGGTPHFSPNIMRSTTWQSSSSLASSSDRSTTSAVSAISLRGAPQQALATALVQKACTVFLGPPAHLVVIMLRIAKRFANGTFGDIFSLESPVRSGRRKVPGSFDLDGSDVEELSDAEEFEEDDFGVPLRSPIRLAARNEALSRTVRNGLEDGLRPRSGWDVD